MPSAADQVCKTCKFFEPTKDKRGECHRYPPGIADRPSEYKLGDDLAKFRLTLETGWCGEWVKR